MSHGLELTCLDSKMVEAEMVANGATPPERLLRLVDRLSAEVGQPPVITYEELVHVNPPDDLRTFTTGVVGAAEAAFYRLHREIEVELEIILATLETGADSSGAMAAVFRMMSELRDGMDPAHFAAFRKFLASPREGFKGPSGAYTASIPLLELRLWREWLPDPYLDYIRAHLGYMPREGRQRIGQALERPSLVAAAIGPTELRRLIPFARFLYAFRLSHYRAVERQVPAAIRDETAGTGGEQEPGKFLRRLAEGTKRLLRRLEETAT